MKFPVKKLFFIFAIFAIILLIAEFLSINKTLVNKNFRSDIYGEGKTCYLKFNNFNFFYNPDIGENTHYEDYMRSRKKLLSEANSRKSANFIPKITHHIWITDAQNPKEITAKDIIYIKKTLEVANKSKGWRNIFWVSDRNLIPKTVNELSSYNLEIKEINEGNLKNFVDIKETYLKSFNYNYAASSDILRYAILEEYGGFYLDVDYELKQNSPLEELLKKHSLIVLEEPNRQAHLSNAFIGSTPHHPVLKESVAAVKRNFSENPPPYVALACNDKYFTFAATGPVMFTISFSKKANENENLNDMFLAGNRRRYVNSPFILGSLIGTHHVSDNWKQKTRQKIYPHCKKCVKYR